MKNTILLGISLLFFVSCNTTQTYQSKRYNNQEKQKDFFYSLYDSDSKTGYSIYNDSNAIQIIICTKERMSIDNILRGGLTFYFNLEAKKYKDVSVTYPIQHEDMNMEHTKGNEQGHNRRKDDNFDAVMLKLPREVKLIKNKTVSIVPIDSLKGFVFELKNDKIHGLIYKIQIPYSFFNFEYNNMESFMLGIATKDQTTNQQGGQGGQGQQGRQGGQQNSMSANPGGGGSRGGTGSTSQQGGGMGMTNVSAFKVWHLINIAK